jgi:hypothetical protein
MWNAVKHTVIDIHLVGHCQAHCPDPRHLIIAPKREFRV